eukprot:gnl/TRDRNA2_/TRDRNA2_40236_c0_seq1.p1 gnl/TRDRNA2_/TRDRNA2_40236_c0~~gnl/TRDRNA2_/TRDRNA2_40236_c0_seq1.p1  ORF type:complete len:416 (-),score=35.94 gnl/TRDRNA2_/TRDRNA2_40236_c0_seq1:27-1274(-)
MLAVVLLILVGSSGVSSDCIDETSCSLVDAAAEIDELALLQVSAKLNLRNLTKEDSHIVVGKLVSATDETMCRARERILTFGSGDKAPSIRITPEEIRGKAANTNAWSTSYGEKRWSSTAAADGNFDIYTGGFEGISALVTYLCGPDDSVDSLKYFHFDRPNQWIYFNVSSMHCCGSKPNSHPWSKHNSNRGDGGSWQGEPTVIRGVFPPQLASDVASTAISPALKHTAGVLPTEEQQEPSWSATHGDLKVAAGTYGGWDTYGAQSVYRQTVNIRDLFRERTQTASSTLACRHERMWVTDLDDSVFRVALNVVELNPGNNAIHYGTFASTTPGPPFVDIYLNGVSGINTFVAYVCMPGFFHLDDNTAIENMEEKTIRWQPSVGQAKILSIVIKSPRCCGPRFIRNGRATQLNPGF